MKTIHADRERDKLPFPAAARQLGLLYCSSFCHHNIHETKGRLKKSPQHQKLRI
jgi:hypothetical protein